MSTPAYGIIYSAQLSGSAVAGLAGDVLIPDATTGLYTNATTANRGTRRSTGVALTAYAAGGVVSIQQFGQLDAATARLSAGAASWVRVSATGSLERVTPSGSDDVVGWCEADGTLHCLFGVLTATITAGGGGGTVPSGTGYRHVTGGTEDAAAVSLTWTGDATGTGTGSSFALTVVKVNGASVPASGALTTGNSTYVSGANALTYSALNLAGGAGWISGTLPVGNGGTGITSLGAGVATWLGTPSGANLGTALTSALALAKVVSPTGTGLVKVSGGAWVAAGATLVDADVNAAAAIAVSKLAPSGTNGWVLTTTGGVPVWQAASGGGASAGGSGQVQTSDGAGGFTAPASVLAGAGFISIGVTPASAGDLRLIATGAVKLRNGAGTGDITAVKVDGSDNMFVGFDSGFADQCGGVYVGGSSVTTLVIGSVQYVTCGASLVTVSQPLVGDSGASSPWGAVDGQATIAVSTLGITLSAAQYSRKIQKFTGSPAAARTITYPAPADEDHSYVRHLRGEQTVSSLTISTGSGTTQSLAVGTRHSYLFTPDGVTLLT